MGKLAIYAADWWQIWKQGFIDSLAVNRCALLFIQSRVVRIRTFQCVILNGIIFLRQVRELRYVQLFVMGRATII